MGTDDEPDFGAALRTLRGARTQRELAELLRGAAADITPQTISNWERNKNPPRDRQAVAALDEALDAAGELLAAAGYSAGEPLAGLRERVTTRG